MRLTRRTMLGMLAAVLLTAGIAEAQDVATRFYLLPQITTGNAFFPLELKYVRRDNGNGIWVNTYGDIASMRYGKEDTMLVAVDVTPAQHTELASNIDVIAIPQNLDSNVSSTALAAVQTQLEGLKIPTQWVTTANTYRDVIGFTGRVFMLMQRFDGLNRRTFFESGITLDTRVNELTNAQKTALQNAAIDLGLDVSTLTPTMKIRAVLKLLVDMMGPFTLRGQTF